MVEPDRLATDDSIIRCMRFACWVNKATNTHSGYVVRIALPLQQWLHERPHCYVVRTSQVLSLLPSASVRMIPQIRSRPLPSTCSEIRGDSEWSAGIRRLMFRRDCCCTPTSWVTQQIWAGERWTFCGRLSRRQKECQQTWPLCNGQSVFWRH